MSSALWVRIEKDHFAAACVPNNCVISRDSDIWNGRYGLTHTTRRVARATHLRHLVPSEAAEGGSRHEDL
jgi:hypothetical protein